MKTKTMLTLLGICLMQNITAQVPSDFTLSTIEPKRNAEEQKAIAFFLKNHPNSPQADYDEFIRSWRNHTKDALITTQKFAQPPFDETLRWLLETINYKKAIEEEVKSDKAR